MIRKDDGKSAKQSGNEIITQKVDGILNIYFYTVWDHDKVEFRGIFPTKFNLIMVLPKRSIR